MAELGQETVVLDYRDVSVILRPSLRAAIRLERLHLGGFPDLVRRIGEFDTKTIWHVLRETGSKEAIVTLFRCTAEKPLQGFIIAAQPACFQIVAMLLPQAPDTTETQKSSGAIPWSDAFCELFKLGVVWLGWTPEVTWSATPNEILTALDAHVEKLKAMNGDADETSPDREKQRQENLDLGLDPDFDRQAFLRLKAKHKPDQSIGVQV